MSNFASLRSTRPPPKKKSNTGLIVGIIIAVIVVIIVVVVIIVIILLRRRNSGTSGGGTAEPECSSDAGCTAGRFCKLPVGLCVECLTDTNCPTGETCNTSTNRCTAPECAVNADCTTAELPVCVSETCVQCDINTDCSGNTIYSSENKNFCGAEKICQECLVNGDCTNGECQNGTCCNLTPPTIASLGQGGNPYNLEINGGYTLAEPAEPGDQIIISVYDGNNNLIHEKAPEAVNGFYSFTQGQIGFPLLGRNFFNTTTPPFIYQVGIELLRSCGATDSSPLFAFTPTLSSTASFAPNHPTVTNSGTTITFAYNVPDYSPWFNDVKLGFIAKKSPFGPANGLGDFSDYDQIGRVLPAIFNQSNNAGTFTYNIYTSVVTLPVAFGETWYFYVFLEGTETNGQTNSPYAYLSRQIS